MTARQVIDQIKELTPEERSQVADYLRQLNEAIATTSGPDDKQVDEISDRILDRHSELMRKLAE